MNIKFTGADGKEHPIYLASYGIGITRVMGVLVEKFADEKGMVWPENVAPAKAYLVRIGGEAATKHADELMSKGVEVLYDDRDERPGAKFADAELMGIPHRITVSDRLSESNSYEYTPRMSLVTEMLTRDQLLAKLN